jgi:hypothetical protein
MTTFLDSLPVATIVHLIACVAVAIIFVVNGGQLPDDTIAFFAILEGGNGAVAIGRGLITNRTPGQ